MQYPKKLSGHLKPKHYWRLKRIIITYVDNVRVLLVTMGLGTSRLWLGDSGESFFASPPAEISEDIFLI